MGHVEWAMWANEQGIASVFVLLPGSIVGIVGMFKMTQLDLYFSYMQYGIYGAVVSLLVLMIEWPRGLRKNGKTQKRCCQWPLTVFVHKLPLLGRNYFVRFIFYLILCLPCCLILATVLGGVCLMITAFIYLKAAVMGEEWKPAGLDRDSGNELKRIESLHPPKKPPPRAVQEDQETVRDEAILVGGAAAKPDKSAKKKSFWGKKKKDKGKKAVTEFGGTGTAADVRAPPSRPAPQLETKSKKTPVGRSMPPPSRPAPKLDISTGNSKQPPPSRPAPQL